MSDSVDSALVANMRPGALKTVDNIQLGGDFWANLQSFELAFKMANALAKSTIIPKEYQNNPSNTLIALEMSARMNTSPMQVMQNLFVINGRPAWSSQYIIAVINSSRKYKHELKFALYGKGNEMSCYAWTTDLYGERIEGPVITMKMAQDEGWISKNGSKWKTMPEVMIRYRAAAFFGRLYCSDMIMGIYDRDEVIEIGEDEYSFVSAQDQAEAVIAKNANTEMIDAGEVIQTNVPNPSADKQPADEQPAGEQHSNSDVTPPEPSGEDIQQTMAGYTPKF